jgi:streptogramin lyase
MRTARAARTWLMSLLLVALTVVSFAGLAETQVEIVVSNTTCAQLHVTQFVFLHGVIPIYAGFSYPGTVPAGQSRTFDFEMQQVPTHVQIGGTRDGQSLQVTVPTSGSTAFACGAISVILDGAASTATGVTAQITRWMIPSSNALPYGIDIAPDGLIYFAEYSANKIGQLDPAANQIRERSVSGNPYGLIVTTAGSLFYTLSTANAVEVMVFTGGSNRWSLPTFNASPRALASAPTGPGQVNLWIAERTAGKVARFAPSQIMMTLPLIITPPTSVPPITSQVPGVPTPVTREFYPGNPMLPPPIASLVPVTTSPFTEWQGPGGVTMLDSVAVGPNGRIWFSDATSPLASLDPTTNTALYYSLPSGTQAFGLTVGPNGWVWFTGSGRPVIGVLNPTTSDVYLWPIPGGIQPFDLVRDSAGNIWFTDREADAIGHLDTTTDQIVMYSLGVDVHPVMLVLDDQERVWFTAERGNYVGRLSVQPVSSPSPAGQGTLHISSTPSGAQVFIDGTYRGSTPLTVPLATGTHSVIVRASGFPDAQRTVTIQSGFSHTMTVTFGSGP